MILGIFTGIALAVLGVWIYESFRRSLDDLVKGKKR